MKFKQIVFTVSCFFALTLSAQWSILPLTTNQISTNQLVGIGTNDPKLKLHIVSEVVVSNSGGLFGVNTITKEPRHIRLTYLRSPNWSTPRNPNNPDPNGNNIISTTNANNYWDIENENSELNFKYFESILS